MELPSVTILKMLIDTLPHKSRNEIEENKPINVIFKFSLIFLCSQVRTVLKMLHKRSFGMFAVGEVIFNTLSSSPFPLSSSSCLFPFHSPWRTQIWHCLALNVLCNGILMCMVQVHACEDNFSGYCGKFGPGTTGNAYFGFLHSKPVPFISEHKEVGFCRPLDWIAVCK